ncbi:AfsR/SARP family transcriptional regulator [Streptomyces sp. WM6368]|uniref:AfsR/SARP family transcriptional regulator n=1 Tax=Streptomyces sp. WM6368 TaxID=1415554 RepID=UPI0006AF4A99|nr:BTAD domain-containing putative transcriptional regulator [Streptomyces sp. WM6368]KOU37215.1 hypothetical protein ADK51_01015 [Streptomyces sp. WM6368]
MRISMLGPLDVRGEDGSGVGVGGTRLRALLILLALEPGRVVAAELLIDGIWQDDPPAGATNALQALVSRLRRALPGVDLQSHPAGYRLVVEPDAVDVVRFEALAAAGRGALARDPEDAARLLRRALELCRGPALLDVPAGPPAAPGPPQSESPLPLPSSALPSPAAVPPLPPTNLPAGLASSVGRDEDLARVAALLERFRLTTLIGPGGAGKTRLAVQSARPLPARFPDGVRLVELAPLGAEGDVSSAVLNALGLREQTPAAGDPLDRLTAALRTRTALLVLDNCEHHDAWWPRSVRDLARVTLSG